MDGFTRTMALTAVTDRETAAARRLFERARDTGVILNASFDDSVWKLTDEVRTCSIRFLPDEDAWEAGGGTWMGIGRDAFMTHMKVFLVFSMGSLALISLRERASAVMDLASCSLKDLEKRPLPLSALLFTELLPPSPERDTAAESLDDLSLPFRKGPGEARDLAPFEAYLRFGEGLDAFWKEAAGDEKVRFFPIRLWWDLTCILPLRPTEFTLIPGGCLRQKDGKCFLTIRRTILKKRRGARGYRVDLDYAKEEYEVTPAIAREILLYMEMAGRTGKEKYLLGGDRLFSYRELRILLAFFQTEVLGISAPEAMVRPGDTRHLAMAGLILSGGSPSVCRALAGHESITVSSHYYANLPSLITSAVYSYSRRRSGTFLADLPSGSLPEKGAVLHRVPGGTCSDQGAAAGDVSECLKVFRAGTGLGACVSCPHFRPDPSRLSMAVKAREEDLRADCAFLVSMVDLVSKGRGHEEGIAAALERLRGSAGRYSSLICRETEVEDHGKA